MEVDDMVSVTDHEAFAEKHMPDLGHDVKDFKVFTWNLTNWKKLEKKLTSQEFECGGHRWRILLFPFGNSNSPPNDTISVYLDCAQPKMAPKDWHACAQLALAISNHNDPTIYSAAHANHRFVAEECDWGFGRLEALRKLFTVQEGYLRPIIEDGAADITAYVRVLEDPTGRLWQNLVNYDSKQETGFVGLKNQGATSYMNSLLQSLFCTNFFRRAMYQIPTEDDFPTESVALALQRLFYHLQTSDRPVGTTELTKSFGWKSLDSFLQHDVQEFNRVLQDKLESKMKGTKAEGAIAKLFMGKMKSYVKCLNVDHQSSRTEEFTDIQLNVKGMRNLYESFKDYVERELLDGENKYLAEGYGLQDAIKGITFESFPPVLHLQLKRFEYDMQRDAMVKINDRHEFPFEIDLAEFLDPNAGRSQPWVYKLHGVLVHSGDLHGGHYFALIKPDRETRWLKFDDARVTPVTDKEVLEDNYGGEPLSALNQVGTMKRFTNAYMLVYIRETAIDEILAPFAPEDTPAHLKRRLDEERIQFEAKKREREEQHLFLTVKIITDETFSRHDAFDLATFDERIWPPSELPTFRILKAVKYSFLKNRVALHFNYPENQIRLWVLVNRQNRTVRPDTPIPENEPDLTVEVIRNIMAARQSDLRLYLDFIPDPSKPDIPPHSIMVFLKHFDRTRQTLHGIGKIYIPRSAKVADLVPLINERMRWTSGTPLNLFEEIKPGMIDLMKPKFTLAQSEIQDGDIICFQVDLPEIEIHDVEAQGLYSNPLQFYDFLQNRVMVIFKPKFEEATPENEFSFVLCKKHNYDLMSRKAGEYLRHDPIKLRFTTTNPTTGQTILKQSLNLCIAEFMAPRATYDSPTTMTILYEKLDVSLVELEAKRSLKVIWTGIHNKEEGILQFLLPKTNMVHDLADNLARAVKLTPGGTGKIRFFEISKDGKMQKEFTGSEMIGNIPELVELYAEEVPQEEYDADDFDKVIGVFHLSKELSRTHGVPFKFVVKPDEKFVNTKKRLQARLGLSDKEIAKYRLALIQPFRFKHLTYFEDEDIIYDHRFAPEDVLGLDLVDESGKTRADQEIPQEELEAGRPYPAPVRPGFHLPSPPSFRPSAPPPPSSLVIRKRRQLPPIPVQLPTSLVGPKLKQLPIPSLVVSNRNGFENFPTRFENDHRQDEPCFSVQSFALESLLESSQMQETIVTVGVPPSRELELPPTAIAASTHETSSAFHVDFMETATITTGDFSFNTARENFASSLLRSNSARPSAREIFNMNWDGESLFSCDTFMTAHEPPPEVLLALGLLMDPIGPQNQGSGTNEPTDGSSSRQEEAVGSASSIAGHRVPTYDVSFIRNATNANIIGSRISFVTNILHYDDKVWAGLHTLHIKSDPTAFHDSYERQKTVHRQMKAVRKWGSQLLITSSITPGEFPLSVPRIKTRDLEEVIKDVFTWLYACSSPLSIMWLYDEEERGNSRTSLIAQFLANFLGERRDLTGSYFYTKPSQADGEGTQSIIPSLALQLTQCIPELETHVALTAVNDPRIFTLSLDQQMKKLLVEPLQGASDVCKTNPPYKFPSLFLIHALEECEDDDFQELFLQAFRKTLTLLQKGRVPQKLMLLGRHTALLRECFSTAGLKEVVRLRLLPISQDVYTD